MSMSDPLGDMLTRIRNGQRANKDVVAVPASKLRSNVLDVLVREGYIRGYSQNEIRKGVGEFAVELKYFDGEPVIKEISRVSKPGRRVFLALKLPHTTTVWVFDLSTPSGVLSDAEARNKNVGGEILCKVY